MMNQITVGNVGLMIKIKNFRIFLLIEQLGLSEHLLLFEFNIVILIMLCKVRFTRIFCV